jgi:hypothetical protein
LSSAQMATPTPAPLVGRAEAHSQNSDLHCRPNTAWLGVQIGGVTASGWNLLKPLDRSSQTAWVYRLEEIVNCASTERLARAVLARAHDNNSGQSGNSPDHLNTSQFRHLKVQENQVGREASDEIDCYRPVFRLSDDRNIVQWVECIAEHSSRNRLIVNDQSPEHKSPPSILTHLIRLYKRILVSGPTRRIGGTSSGTCGALRTHLFRVFDGGYAIVVDINRSTAH